MTGLGDYVSGMLGWLRRLFARPPTAFEVLAGRVSAARLEAARLAAYARVGRERLDELVASQRRWERRARLAADAGLGDLADAARAAALEDAGRVRAGREWLRELESDARHAEEYVDGMLAELERISLSAVSVGARLPVVVIDDAAAYRKATAEADEAGRLDGLDDAMDRDFLERTFEAIERGTRFTARDIRGSH